MEISLYDELVINEARSVDFPGSLREYWQAYPYRHDDLLFRTARKNKTLKNRLLNGTPIVAALEHQLGDTTQLSNPSNDLELDLEALIGYRENNAGKVWATTNLAGRIVLMTLTQSPVDILSTGFAVLNVGVNTIKKNKTYKEMRKRAEFIDGIVKSSGIY